LLLLLSRPTSPGEEAVDNPVVEPLLALPNRLPRPDGVALDDGDGSNDQVVIDLPLPTTD